MKNINQHLIILLFVACVVFGAGYSFLYEREVDSKVEHSYIQTPLVTTKDQELLLFSPQSQPMLVSFFFTQCSTLCPLQTAKLLAVQRSLPPDILEQSRFLSVSVDPLDSLERIRAYQDAFGVNDEHWVFAKTKTPIEHNRLIEHLDLVSQASGSGQEIDHRMVFLFLDKSGRIVQRYQSNTVSTSRLVNDLISLINLSNGIEL